VARSLARVGSPGSAARSLASARPGPVLVGKPGSVAPSQGSVAPSQGSARLSQGSARLSPEPAVNPGPASLNPQPANPVWAVSQLPASQ